MGVTFEPLGRQVLLTREPEPEASTILTVIRKEGFAVYYRVVAVGPEVRDVKAGDRVLASSMAGLDLDLGEPQVLMTELAILAVDA